MRGKLLYLLILLLATGACFNLNRLSLYNLSGLYSNTMFTELEAVAFNTEGNKASIFVPLHMQDLSAEADDNGKSYSKARLTYQFFRDYESKNMLDSASLIITDSTLRVGDTLIKLIIEYPENGVFLLKLELQDMHRADVVQKFINLEKSAHSRNNYLPLDADGQPIFDNVIGAGEPIRFKVSGNGQGPLWVHYYKRDFPIATPPFADDVEYAFNYSADSVFTLQLSGGISSEMELTDEGFYHFRADTNVRDGYTIYRFYDGFPKVVNTQQMLQPLRYITTRNEFDALAGASDVKLALDNFWIENAGNTTRARAMIQKFYGRVEDANNFFSTYHEGWKTDRGLIYIIYGPPQNVYRGDQLEEWLYGEKGNANSIRFTFVRMQDPFSDNDYSLVKSPSYKEKWYNIVNSWRR